MNDCHKHILDAGSNVKKGNVVQPRRRREKRNETNAQNYVSEYPQAQGYCHNNNNNNNEKLLNERVSERKMMISFSLACQKTPFSRLSYVWGGNSSQNF